MTIPKHLRWYEQAYARDPVKLTRGRKEAEEFVARARNVVKSEPRYDDIGTAIKAALKLHFEAEKAKDFDKEFASIWKEPVDIGNGYAIISFKNREKANNAGYVETVTDEQIYEAAKRNGIDEIEEI